MTREIHNITYEKIGVVAKSVYTYMKLTYSNDIAGYSLDKFFQIWRPYFLQVS